VGCAIAKRVPPYSTTQAYFYTWRDTSLMAQDREGFGATGLAQARPQADIDSQSASTAQAGGPRGFDPGKRVHGCKRHIVTDTNDLLLAVHVHPA
jgi:putative transposase